MLLRQLSCSVMTFMINDYHNNVMNVPPCYGDLGADKSKPTLGLLLFIHILKRELILPVV